VATLAAYAAVMVTIVAVAIKRRDVTA